MRIQIILYSDKEIHVASLGIFVYKMVFDLFLNSLEFDFSIFNSGYVYKKKITEWENICVVL